MESVRTSLQVFLSYVEKLADFDGKKNLDTYLDTTGLEAFIMSHSYATTVSGRTRDGYLTRKARQLVLEMHYQRWMFD